MKKPAFLFFGILLYAAVRGQALSPTIVISLGDYFANSNNTLSWTIGECIIETSTSINNILTQGFQQSTYLITSIENNSTKASFVFVSPNPCNSFINIWSEPAELKTIKVDLIDVVGKLVHSQVFLGNSQLNLSGSDGIYFIRIFDEGNKLMKTVKLLKMN